MEKTGGIPDDPEETRHFIATLPKGIVSVKTIRGKTRKGVDYLNVENYLTGLPESATAIMKKGVTGKPDTSD